MVTHLVRSDDGVAMSAAAATAVVVTHNSAGQIADCLAALQDAGMAIRVVDNASSDGTVRLIRRRFPAVDLVAGRENVGFARAVNRAAAGVTGEVILLVNPDCVIPPATTGALLAFLADHPSVGITGPALVGPDGRLAVSAHPFETVTSVVVSRFGGTLLPVRARRLVSGPARRRAYDSCRAGAPAATSVDWLSGACLAVRTDLFHAIGGLDEAYFLYYEDEELCLQARRRRFDVVHLPTVRASHIGGASSELGATWPHLYRSMLIFFGRHRPAGYPAVRLAVLVRAALGMGIGAARRVCGGRSGTARMLAWSRVARVAWRGETACAC